MKRIITTLLTITMLAFSWSSIAEDIDLSIYSDEELRTLADRIEIELLDRKGIEYWFDYGLGQYIPKITLISGEEPKLKTVVINEENRMYLTVMEAKQDDFEIYIQTLQLLGFDKELEHTTTTYVAKDHSGHIIDVHYSSLIEYLKIEARLDYSSK